MLDHGQLFASNGVIIAIGALLVLNHQGKDEGVGGGVDTVGSCRSAGFIEHLWNCSAAR